MKVVILALIFLTHFCHSWDEFLRRLYGSKCIVIERGKVSEYTLCAGCIVEEATACVEDMRQNKSGNVWHGCDILKLMENYATNDGLCCPQLRPDHKGRPDLYYPTSAYPEALRCLQSIGCGDFIIYQQLKTECLNVCPPSKYKDQQGGPACFADFNSASKLPFGRLFLFVVFVAVVLCW